MNLQLYDRFSKLYLVNNPDIEAQAGYKNVIMVLEMRIKNRISLTENDLTIIEAKPKQEEMFRNLVNLQFHDLSEYRDNFEILEDGRFAWTFSECFNPDNEHHHPLLILYRERIAGFLIFSVFKGTHPEADFQLVEFFILRMYRRKGIGKKAVKMIFENYKGKYQLDVIKNNIPALKFWQNLIKQHSAQIIKKPFAEEGTEYIKYIFTV